ncbi:MAG TPA: NUDIX hydrolase [Candidatus Limnocylindrales bacterium]
MTEAADPTTRRDGAGREVAAEPSGVAADPDRPSVFSPPPGLAATGDPDLDRRLAAIHAADDELRETVLDRRTVHRSGYLAVEADTVRLGDGAIRPRDIVVHPGAVVILALDEAAQVLFVRQYRLAAGRALLELPAGTLDRHPDGTVEDPAVAAPRELEEETGYRAERWRRLGGFWTAPGFATEFMTLFLATGLRPAHHADRLHPDEDERLELVRLPWPDARRAAEAGAFEDAKTLLGLLWLARLEATGALERPDDGSAAEGRPSD